MAEPAELAAELAKSAGFLAAHAVWCVSDGEVLVPFVGAELTGGKRELTRFADEARVEQAVERAKAAFVDNLAGARMATLVFDGYVTLPSGPTDALVIASRTYSAPVIELELLIPYRNAASQDGFAVYRPKFTKVPEPLAEAQNTLAEAFFAGVDAHEQGSTVWNRHIDQSR